MSADRPAAAPRRLRILLVEDHTDTARVMKRLLSAAGHDVQQAGDVASALKLTQERTFDILLSDLGLPDRSGLDLMRQLRERGLTLPGIALSGYGQEADLQASRDAGFLSHLTKPINPAKLQQTIAMVVDRKT
jgi:CheY-like chemotaxis protein